MYVVYVSTNIYYTKAHNVQRASFRITTMRVAPDDDKPKLRATTANSWDTITANRTRSTTRSLRSFRPPSYWLRVLVFAKRVNLIRHFVYSQLRPKIEHCILTIAAKDRIKHAEQNQRTNNVFFSRRASESLRRKMGNLWLGFNEPIKNGKQKAGNFFLFKTYRQIFLDIISNCIRSRSALARFLMPYLQSRIQ